MVKKTEYFLNDIGVKGVVANNTVGATGEVLTSNGSSTYWALGPSGYTGSRGDTGYVGSKGDIGYTGSQGTTGFTGSTGSRGNIGFTGSLGAQGPQGAIGFTGSLGAQGPQGATGPQGPIGFTGSTGSRGNIGFTGSLGAQGPIGFTGSAGPVAGTNTQIVFNDSGVANGSASFTFNKTTGAVVHAGAVSGVTTLAAGNTTITGDVSVSGNMGLGTTAPISGYKLTVEGVGAYAALRCVSASGFSALFGFDGATQRWCIGQLGFGGNNGLGFYVGNQTEVGRFDASGNLLVGTTSAYAKLTVIGNNGIYIRGSGAAGYNVLQAQNDGGISMSMGVSGSTAVGWTTNLAHVGTTSNSPLAFGTNSAERMRIDSSGNVGLNVIPPTGGYGRGLYMNDASDGALNGLWSQAINTDDRRFSITNNAYNSGVGAWKYGKSSTSATMYEQVAGQHRFFTAPAGTGGATIAFTQAMTLDSSGNFGIGTTNPSSSTLAQGVGITGNSAPAMFMGHANGTGSGATYIGFVYNSTGIGSITQSGTTAVLYNTTSDSRLKKNVANADDAASLIDALQVRKFDWKAEGTHQRYGFVAQELLEVAPEAVHQPEDPEEMMGVDYSKLVPMLIKELQSVRARLAELEGKL